MARQTRQERKARRAQQAESSAAAARRSRQSVPARATGDGETSADAAPERQRRSSFVAESWGELQKVEWPGQRQVMQGTVVVLIACAIVGAYLWGADLVLKRVVQNILLG